MNFDVYLPNSTVPVCLVGLSDTFSPNKINFSKTVNQNQPPIDVQISINLTSMLNILVLGLNMLPALTALIFIIVVIAAVKVP